MINKFWENGYQGLTVTVCVGSRGVWCFHLTRNSLQIGLYWIHFIVNFYDEYAVRKDFIEPLLKEEMK